MLSMIILPTLTLSETFCRKQKKRKLEETGVEIPEEQELILFQDISKLQDLGISVADINKLKVGGCVTANGVLMMPKRVTFVISTPYLNVTSIQELMKIKGLSEAKVDKIIEVARRLVGDCV